MHAYTYSMYVEFFELFSGAGLFALDFLFTLFRKDMLYDKWKAKCFTQGVSNDSLNDGSFLFYDYVYKVHC